MMPTSSLNIGMLGRDGKPVSPRLHAAHDTPREIFLWRRLRRGMSTAEVLGIFGEPTLRTPSEGGEIWRYESGHSIMDLTLTFRASLLFRWTEPNPDLYMANTRRPGLQPA